MRSLITTLGLVLVLVAGCEGDRRTTIVNHEHSPQKHPPHHSFVIDTVEVAGCHAGGQGFGHSHNHNAHCDTTGGE